MDEKIESKEKKEEKKEESKENSREPLKIKHKVKFKTKLGKFHDKNYKLLLLIPIAIFIFSFIFMGVFYSNTGEFLHKDISLTGGTSITIFEKIDINTIKDDLSNDLGSLNVREISDLITREQIAVVIETTTNSTEAKGILEEYLGYPLTEENSGIEFTGTALSENFFNQLLLALILAFSFMGWVVFLLFGKGLKFKIITGILVFTSAILSFQVLEISLGLIFSFGILLVTTVIYLFHSIPSLAVIISAFANIFMTLTLLNLLNISMSTSGVVALLMLIGYSVDTDILMVNRILKRKEGSLNSRIFSAFSTGITMTLTSLVALITALIILGSFSPVLTTIFTVLIIGLSFDLINTWITNASIMKWYVKSKEE
ncbi:hypothetical protein K0A97_02905 [Patescibacteria group bacterium]|nr:hypothetical protein [Patescibacteria group bacterium]